MASCSKHGPTRRLAELLEEQQEPFVLEIYLLERGCSQKTLELKRSSTYNGVKRASYKTSGQFLNVVRNLYKKLVSINPVLGLMNNGFLGEKKHETNHWAMRNDKTAVAESGRISSVSSCNTCSVSEATEETTSSPAKNETCELSQTAPEGVMTLMRFMVDNKQCSPVSVLDEIDFLQGFPVYNARQGKTTSTSTSTSRIKLQKKKLDDLILSKSLRELLSQSQLRKGNAKQLSVEKANIRELLRMDLISGSTQEWGGWKAYRRLIALEIEYGILREITDELVRDMSDQF